MLKRELSGRGSELLRGHRESPIRFKPQGGIRMHLQTGHVVTHKRPPGKIELLLKWTMQLTAIRRVV